MTINIKFDNIAQSYSAQRAHPSEVSAHIGPAIAALAGRGSLVLELGVGTGRIAWPVAAAGCRVVGIDIAHDMLQVAHHAAADIENTGGAQHLSLLQGDVARLPFADQSFDAVLAVHVLHLIPDWRAALVEIARVMRPGGVFIQGRDWRDPASASERLRAKLREAVMELVPGGRPPGAGAAIAQSLAKLGGTPEAEITAATWVSQAAPAAIIANMAARADAETWALDDATLQQAVERVRAFAESTYPDLDTPQEIAQRFVLNPVRF